MIMVYNQGGGVKLLSYLHSRLGGCFPGRLPGGIRSRLSYRPRLGRQLNRRRPWAYVQTITVASRKGGQGKSFLAESYSRPCAHGK